MSNGRLIVIVGGQYGSEAKGKAAQFLASYYNATLAIRSGGINAGHTVGIRIDRPTQFAGMMKHSYDEVSFITRTLPSALAIPTCRLALAPGAIVEPTLLEDEIRRLKDDYHVEIRSRLTIDPCAFVLERTQDKLRESGWSKSIGSTETGTGAALVRRIERRDGNRVLTDPRFHQWHSASVPKIALDMLYSGGTAMLEGTQGYGLSLYHGNWPHVTSRDTTAMALMSECGIPGWSHVNSNYHYSLDVCMVVRTFPIRVGGPSGWMQGETNWDDIRSRSGRKDDEVLTETTSVTKRTRRVGEFDDDLFVRAVRANHPTMIAVHGADYLDVTTKGCRDWEKLSGKVFDFIARLERLSDGVPVKLVFTGTGADDLCWRGDD